MPKYATKTEVSSTRTRADIEDTLLRYGASGFGYVRQNDKAMIAFAMQNRQIRFILPLPNPNDREFTHTPARGTPRSQDAQRDAYEQAERQRWRALSLVIKAKLEAVECGIAEFEREFLGNIVLPDGRTAGDFMLPQIEQAYETRCMPSLLPILTDGGSV